MDPALQATLEFQAKRGGKQQRLKARELLEKATTHEEKTILTLGGYPIDSELAHDMIGMWVWGKGKTSAVNIQQKCQLAYKDHVRVLTELGESTDHAPMSLKVLARLGTEGKYPGNCNRELKALLGEPRIPKTTQVDIPIKLTKQVLGKDVAQKNGKVRMPFLLPHVIFSYYFNFCRNLFNQLFLGPEGGADKLEAFWNAMEQNDDPRLRDHPMKSRANWKKKAVPIVVHGDAVPVISVGRSGTKSLDNLAWHSLLAHGSSVFMKLLVYAIFVDNVIKGTEGENVTMNEIWKVAL